MIENYDTVLVRCVVMKNNNIILDERVPLEDTSVLRAGLQLDDGIVKEIRHSADDNDQEYLIIVLEEDNA